MSFESDLDGSENLEVVSQVSEIPEATPEVVAGLRQLARSCAEHLRTLLRNEEERADAYDSKEGHWASHHFSEFNLWCAKIGVHGEGLRSLEVRLKDVPEICNLLRSHLQSLKQDLEDLQQPIAAPKEPSLSQEVSYNDKSPQNLHGEASFQYPMPDNTVPNIPKIEVDDVSSNSSQLSFDSLPSLPRSTDEEPPKKSPDTSNERDLALRRHIQATIERLHGHALRIEGAGAQHRRKRIEIYRQKPRPSWMYDRYKELAGQKARVQFPLASDAFKERIAESFARRRIRFDYLRDHQKKRAIQSQRTELPSRPGTEPNPQSHDVGATPQAEDYEPGFKPDQPPQPRAQDQKTIYTTTEDTKLDMGRPKSEPKRADSVASIALRPELPPPPYFRSTTFQCPYCRIEFRAAEAEKNSWAEHVMQDFEPYFCIFEDCEAPFDVPNHFDGLLNHLHTHLEEYYHIDMPDGKHEELDEAGFEEYVMQQGKISSETLALLKETSRRKGAFLFQSCPFCGGYPDDVEKLFPERDTIGAQKALRHHIRSHMRYISLFLPPYRDDIFDQRDGDEISHRASQSVGHSIPRSPESFLLTCEREDCDCKTSGKRGEDATGNSSVDKTPVLETPLSVPQTDENFWTKKLADFPRYDRTAATDDDYLEDERLGPFIERFQSSNQPYPDPPSLISSSGPTVMTTRKKLSSPALYSIVWVAALPIERAAATALLDERHDEPEDFDQHANDANAYDWGQIGQHNVVVASLPAGVYGITSSAITASHLLSSLPHIRIGLLVGIGGGIPRPDRDIRLGDVVVSQPDGQNGGVVQYDLVKAKANRNWELKGSLNMPPPVLLNALGKVQAEHEVEDAKIMDLLQGLVRKYPRMKKHYVHQGEENDRLFSSEYEHAGGRTCDACDSSKEVKRPERETTDPEIHYGKVASGNTLVKDAGVRDSILEVVGEECLCVEMEAAGLMNNFPCLVIRGICDYADSHKNDRWQRYAATTAAAFTVELLGCVRAKQLEETPSVRERMVSIAKVDHKITHLKESTDSSHSKMVLNRLPIAAGAAHDSSDSWLQATCLENTRVDVLREIYEWASDLDSNSTTLFWLNGMAGTGKSTISRTVAQHLAKEKVLGGSFFFKKGETDLSNPFKLFTTLAAGLSRWQSAVSKYIGQAIDENPQIFDQLPHQQFSKLILEPISQATLRSGKPIVMVIDALDECQHHSITSIILDILPRARSLRHPRLKFFLTSRPELPIQAGFLNVERRNTYQDMILQNVPRVIIQKDLETFLRRTIEQIRIRYDDGSGRLPPSWPGKDAIQRLVNMATPLFIVASTACRFLEDRRLGNPKRQMDKILAVKDRTHASMLDQMYLAVLCQQFEDGPDSYTPQQKSQIVDEFRLIVGSIILLSTPLTIPVLAQLLHGDHDVSDFQETVENRLELLHSVLIVPPPSQRHNSPIRALHSSFRNFLVDGECQDVNPFWVDEAKAHLVLVESCLRVMQTSLGKNICKVSDPGTQKASVIQEIVNDCLPPHVQYACLHWIDHVEQAHIDSGAGKLILAFLELHLLHWLEALSFLNRVLESVVMVERLKSVTQNAGLPQLSELLSDSIRFTGANATAIDLAPLQVYSSALVFAPLKSLVRDPPRPGSGLDLPSTSRKG